MFKSGQSISIRSPEGLKSRQAILVAPKIDIMGLVLRANTAITQEVLDFFTEKGATITQFMEDGDNLVRMTGSFEITAAEIQSLLEIEGVNVELLNDGDAKEVAELKASNFQRQVQANLVVTNKIHTTKLPEDQSIGLVVEHHVVTAEPSYRGMEHGNLEVDSITSPVYHISGGTMGVTLNSLTITTKEELVMTGQTIYAGKDVALKAGTSIRFETNPVGETNTGFLITMTAGRDADFHSRLETCIKNAIIFSGREVKLKSDEGMIDLAQDHEVMWFNAPTVPSIVFAYEAQQAARFAGLEGDVEQDQNLDIGAQPAPVQGGAERKEKVEHLQAVADFRNRLADQNEHAVLIKLLKKYVTKAQPDLLPTPELALRRASAFGNLEHVISLFKLVKDLDMNQVGESRKTALDFAKERKKENVAAFLNAQALQQQAKRMARVN